MLEEIRNGREAKRFGTIRARKAGDQVGIDLAVSPAKVCAGLLEEVWSLVSDIADNEPTGERVRNSGEPYRFLSDCNPFGAFSSTNSHSRAHRTSGAGVR
jgi:hypothetical protein